MQHLIRMFCFVFNRAPRWRYDLPIVLSVCISFRAVQGSRRCCASIRVVVCKRVLLQTLNGCCCVCREIRDFPSWILPSIIGEDEIQVRDFHKSTRWCPLSAANDPAFRPMALHFHELARASTNNAVAIFSSLSNCSLQVQCDIVPRTEVRRVLQDLDTVLASECQYQANYAARLV